METDGERNEVPVGDVKPEVSANLPMVVPLPGSGGKRRRRLAPILLPLLLLLAGAGFGYRSLHTGSGLPPGIASGNGRLEADEIDIDTKYAGRIAKLLADEGDRVKAGQAVAVMDTRDLEATLKKDEELVLQAQQAVDQATANLTQQKTQVLFAVQELDRTKILVPEGFATRETYDQRRQQLNSAIAGQNAATAQVSAATHALNAAKHDVELYKVEIADNTLLAPRDGLIEYRVANIGEVLPAGGKVFTMLDAGNVYIDIYLPTMQAGRTRIGSDAKIVLDAYPGRSVPAKVIFVAAQAQFTPKTVETKDERDTLMFRVRVQIDPEHLRQDPNLVRSGLPAVAFVRTDPAAVWPAPPQDDTAK